MKGAGESNKTWKLTSEKLIIERCEMLFAKH